MPHAGSPDVADELAALVAHMEHKPRNDAEGEGAFGMARYTPFPPGGDSDGFDATFGSDEEDTFSGVPRQVQGGAHSAGEPFRGIGGGRPRRLSESEPQKAPPWEVVPAIGGSLTTPPISRAGTPRQSRKRAKHRKGKDKGKGSSSSGSGSGGGGGGGGGLFSWFGGLLPGNRRKANKGQSWPLKGSREKSEFRAAVPAGFEEKDGVFTFELPDDGGSQPRSG